MGDVEKKVDLMFDFIQDHEQRQMKQQDDIQVSFNNSHQVSEEEEEEIDINNLQTNELVEISENEDDSEEDDSEDDSEDENDNGVVSGEEIVLEAVPQLEDITQTNKVDSNLSELNEVEEVKIEGEGTISLLKNDEIDSLDELTDGDSSEEEEEEKEEVKEEKVNYNKLTMAVLKELAGKKGLTGYKSLKKAALIQLIENN